MGQVRVIFRDGPRVWVDEMIPVKVCRQGIEFIIPAGHVAVGDLACRADPPGQQARTGTLFQLDPILKIERR